MPDTHYENARLAALYDADNGWAEDREHYLALAGATPIAVLDVGCGTGLLCERFAGRGHRVVGLDPSRAMLEVARGRPHGSLVRWIESSLSAFASDERFDLIVMTGHVFQVFLSDADVDTAFARMREHLAPDGTIAFESRNPRIDWAREWNTEHVPEALEDVVVTRRTTGRRGERLSFATTYTFPDEAIVSESTLRFMTEGEILDRLERAALEIVRLAGDWHGEPFDPETSREMIFTVRARDVDRNSMDVRAPGGILR